MQTQLPTQVVLVRAGAQTEADECGVWTDWIERFRGVNSTLEVVFHPKPLMPGGARNLGLDHANQEWIAFLDIETIPSQRWLETQLLAIIDKQAEGVLGATIYVANSFMSELIRDAIYGRRPIPTIPGAVLHSKVFINVGRFIANIRAAEDTEWMIRAKAIGIRFALSIGDSVQYVGLQRNGLLGMARKWRRNYLSSKRLQHLKVQTTLIWLAIYTIASLAAFNWNAIVAGWEVTSPFYLDHVTKIVSLAPLFVYLLIRGVLLPFSRGVKLHQLLPLRFLGVAGVGALLDAIKITSVIYTRPRGA